MTTNGNPANGAGGGSGNKCSTGDEQPEYTGPPPQSQVSAPSCARQRLPNRRESESFNFEVDGLRYTAMFSRFADGRIAELFLTNHKCGNASDTNARDASITFSIAVQHGADPDVIRLALCRDSKGRPSGPLSAALDRIMGSSS